MTKLPQFAKGSYWRPSLHRLAWETTPGQKMSLIPLEEIMLALEEAGALRHAICPEVRNDLANRVSALLQQSTTDNKRTLTVGAAINQAVLATLE